jgi:outer membrane murein-binding lipoprotein Lpp
MIKVVRSALVIAVIYFAGSYYYDQPQEIAKDAKVVREMVADLPEPEQVMAKVRATGSQADRRVSRAKQRLDAVREKVQHSIAKGSERFANSD